MQRTYVLILFSEGPVSAEVPAIQSAVNPDASATKRKIIKLANGNEIDLDSIKVRIGRFESFLTVMLRLKSIFAYIVIVKILINFSLGKHI